MKLYSNFGEGKDLSMDILSFAPFQITSHLKFQLYHKFDQMAHSNAIDLILSDKFAVKIDDF